MDKILLDFENLKISAFTKYTKLTGDINSVTIGPNSTFLLDVSREDEPKKQRSDANQQKTPDKDKSPLKSPLPINHVLREYEIQRREKVREAVDDHYNRFEKFTKAQTEEKEHQWFLKQQAFIKSMQESERMIVEAVSQSDVDSSHQNETLIKHYQDLIKRKLAFEQQLEKNKEKQRILNENIEKIKKSQTEFRTIYQEIIALIKSCASSEELRKLVGDNFKLLKSLPESLDEIITKCKQCNIDEEQILQAVNVLNQIKILKAQIQEIVIKINNRKNEEQVKIAAEPPPIIKNNMPLKTPSENKSPICTLDQGISETNFKKYNEVRQFLTQHSELFKELLADDSLKQFRFDCKKAVNLPVNALSAVNAEHLKDKYMKLNNLLSGKTVSIADKQINASKHPQGIPFCMDLLAKKFVLQGDLLISSNPEAAFCYATILVSLWNDFPDFGKLLLGYFYTQCPYVLPFYKHQTENQTNEEYYTSLGYCYVDGQIEKQDKFLKRMTGILRLYFAILIAKPKRGQTKNPYDIKNAWNFLASILKLNPLLDITATTLHVFLETIGFEMERVYGVAFKKLVKIIMEKFLSDLKKFDSGGPVSRLEVLLQDYRTKGHFDKPHGVLSDNFW